MPLDPAAPGYLLEPLPVGGGGGAGGDAFTGGGGGGGGACSGDGLRLPGQSPGGGGGGFWVGVGSLSGAAESVSEWAPGLDRRSARCPAGNRCVRFPHGLGSSV